MGRRCGSFGIGPRANASQLRIRRSSRRLAMVSGPNSLILRSRGGVCTPTSCTREECRVPEPNGTHERASGGTTPSCAKRAVDVVPVVSSLMCLRALVVGVVGSSAGLKGSAMSSGTPAVIVGAFCAERLRPGESGAQKKHGERPGRRSAVSRASSLQRTLKVPAWPTPRADWSCPFGGRVAPATHRLRPGTVLSTEVSRFAAEMLGRPRHGRHANGAAAGAPGSPCSRPSSARIPQRVSSSCLGLAARASLADLTAAEAPEELARSALARVQRRTDARQVVVIRLRRRCRWGHHQGRLQLRHRRFISPRGVLRARGRWRPAGLQRAPRRRQGRALLLQHIVCRRPRPWASRAPGMQARSLRRGRQGGAAVVKGAATASFRGMAAARLLWCSGSPRASGVLESPYNERFVQRRSGAKVA